MRGPAPDCPLCPRLAAFRADNRARFPDFHNGPVPSFGDARARLLVVGLAPGLKGANRTARPFTGDHAGDLLYPTLAMFGFARGTYAARPDDGIEMVDCRITNAVRCVPPQNKPVGGEIRTCRPFLEAEFEAMADLRAVIALGTVAHNATLAGLGYRQSAFRFSHGAMHEIAYRGRPLLLADSYHCSRYNTNTGRLTAAMFESVFAAVRDRLGAPA